MRALRVVPAQIVGDVRAGRAHAVVGFQVDAFVFDAAPQTFDKDVVAPGAAPGPLPSRKKPGTVYLSSRARPQKA